MKLCKGCKKDKPLSDFSPSMQKSKKGFCKQCAARYQREWRERNIERSRAIKNAHYRKRPKRHMLYTAKKRAKNRNIAFRLAETDFDIPEYCPVLGIRLSGNGGSDKDTSPSLDRTIPSLGYVPENVTIMSWRANRLKSDGTADEHEKIASFMREKT